MNSRSWTQRRRWSLAWLCDGRQSVEPRLTRTCNIFDSRGQFIGHAPSRGGTDVACFAVAGAITRVYPRMTEDAGEKLTSRPILHVTAEKIMLRQRDNPQTNRGTTARPRLRPSSGRLYAGNVSPLARTKGDALRPVARRMPLSVVRKSP